MTSGSTKSGIGAVGDIPWGTHFCHFYENKRDLLEILIPYFKAGLEQNELCVWSLFEALDEREARAALGQVLPGAEERFAAGDIEIVPGSQLVRDWESKLEKALATGYAGMRVNFNAAWLIVKDQPTLDAYEDEFSRFIANRQVIMLCTYPQSAEDAGYTHRFAIGRRDKAWQVVETPELKEARANVKRLHAELKQRDIERERSLCYFELGLVGMAIVSPTEGCIEVNNRFCDILGYQRSELMQMTWAAVSHADDLAGDLANYHRILAGEVDGFLKPKRWICKDGDIVHTKVSVKCRRRDDGTVNYFVAMIEEVGGPGVPGSRGGSELSRREREVARLIGRGRTVKEIAAELMLSEKTVSTYRTRILFKLKLKSTAELIRYALKNRLAE